MATADSAPAVEDPKAAAKVREDSLDQLARLLPELDRLVNGGGLDQKIRDAVRAEFARQDRPGVEAPAKK